MDGVGKAGRQADTQGPCERRTPGIGQAGKGFREVFESSLRENLRFSRHALNRIGETGVQLSQADLQDIERAVDKLAEKGGRDSLLLMNDLALVVSVRSRTVVTVVDKSRMSERVFTNIDSLMLVDRE